jgi:hypothetical protein
MGPQLRGASLAVCLLVLSPSGAEAATFRFVSQNCLHLGWAGFTPTKEATLTTNFGTAQVVVLQEVMAATAMGTVTPIGTYTALVSPLKGNAGYQEIYGFLVDSFFQPSAVYNYPDTNSDFMRPPSAVLLQPGGGNQSTWVVNYHAIWGKSSSVRRAEVSKIGNTVTWFTAQTNPSVNRVIIGGDWNLNGTNAAFGTITGMGYTIAPNVKTSLGKNGTFSQPYDHCVYNVAVTGTGLMPFVSGPWWRTNVSDHLGIYCDVTY